MLKIVDIGLILQSSDGKDFRYITVRDGDSLIESKYMVYRYNQPYLWKNIEKAEKNNYTAQTLPGRIERYNGLDIVIFEGEDAKDAFEKQKWKIREQNKITRKETEKKISESEGFQTNNSKEESLNMKWQTLSADDHKIRFRYYHKSSKLDINKHSYFEWTSWYEILD